MVGGVSLFVGDFLSLMVGGAGLFVGGILTLGW